MSAISEIVKGFFKGALLVGVTVAIALCFLSSEDLRGIQSISAASLMWIVFITQLVYLISGIELSVIVYSNSRVRLTVVDTMLLPITMNLWSFIIPFQGSLVYSTLFLKYKYHTSVSEAVSTSIFSYLLAMVLTGLFGLVLVFLNGGYFSWSALVSLGLFFFPLSLFAIDFAIIRSGIGGVRFLIRLTELVRAVIGNLRQLLQRKMLLFTICCTNTLHLVACFLMNYWTAIGLGIEASTSSILVFTLIIRLSVILKITPGNVGVQELLSGGVFSILMLKPSDGVLITLVSRVTTLFMMCTIGVLHTYFNSGYFEIRRVFARQSSAPVED